MSQAAPVRKPAAPIFVLADDDRDALERLIASLNTQWYYIPVWEGRSVVRYARQLATTAIFLSDSIAYPEGGAARLLQELIDSVGKPVIILAEEWTPEIASQWKAWGAANCIPHPTRSEHRLEALRASMQEQILKTKAPILPEG
jgi:DNA-binding NtrC family response regulator